VQEIKGLELEMMCMVDSFSKYVKGFNLVEPLYLRLSQLQDSSPSEFVPRACKLYFVEPP
jgi:hypothetical protein